MKLPAIPSPETLKVFETLPDLYLILSPELIILTASNSYLEATLTERGNITGKNIFDVFPDNPQTPQAKAVSNLRASFLQVLSSRKPHQMDIQHYDVPHPSEKDKFVERYWAPLNTPVLDEEGEVSYIIHKVINVTDKIQVKRQLTHSQEREKSALTLAQWQRDRMERFLMQMPAGICMFAGKDFVYDFVNPTYQNQLFPGREILGKPLFEAVPEVKDTPIAQVLKQVLATGETIEGKEMYIPLAPYDGAPLEDHYFNFIQQARLDEHGQVDGIITFAYDITELVVARKRVEQSEREAQDLNKELASTNEELRKANDELRQTQHALQQLNEHLEQQVANRTKQLRLAQGEAQAQAARLERFFMQAPAAICVLDGPELVFELVNPSYHQLFPGRRLLGKTVLEALPEIEGQPIHQILQNVYLTGETFHGKEILVPLARYEGAPLEDIYFNFIYQARYNEQGKVDGILVFAYEVTEGVIARKTIEANAQQLRLITDSLPVLIGYLDKEEKYRFANQAYQVWFNQNPEELLGRPVREVLGEKAYSGLKKYIERAQAGERLDFEARMPYQENFIKHIRTSYVPDIREGKVEGFYTLVSDVSEQVEARAKIEEREKQAQALAEDLAAANEKLKSTIEELSKSNQQLSYINSDMDGFIYTASHDLRAPISNIEGLMNIIFRNLSTESKQSPVIQRLFGLIEDSIERFKKTLEGLTQVTKIQREESGEDNTEVDLGQIVEDVRLDLASQIEQADARIEMNLQEGTHIQYSPKNARSIVYNLLSNAIKYRAADRPVFIRINSYRQDDYLVLSVEDNGLGMDLNHEDKIFGMFKRLHDHVEGSGVGLYIVKKIVENAGGKIEVQSTLNQGSTFKVYFKQ